MMQQVGFRPGGPIGWTTYRVPTPGVELLPPEAIYVTDGEPSPTPRQLNDLAALNLLENAQRLLEEAGRLLG